MSSFFYIESLSGDMRRAGDLGRPEYDLVISTSQYDERLFSNCVRPCTRYDCFPKNNVVRWDSYQYKVGLVRGCTRIPGRSVKGDSRGTETTSFWIKFSFNCNLEFYIPIECSFIAANSLLVQYNHTYCIINQDLWTPDSF